MRLAITLFILTAWTVYSNGAESQHGSNSHPDVDQHHSSESIEGHVYTGWESRYFLEGRDELHGNGLWVSEIELEWDHFSTGIWYGRSPGHDFDELHFNLGAHKSVGNILFSAEYIHKKFPQDTHHDDDNIVLGIEWMELPMHLEFVAEVLYSFEQDGYFVEAELLRKVHLTDKFGLEFIGMFGWNEGYAHHGHYGANHIAARILVEYEITHSWAIISHITYSWALGKDSHYHGDDHLIDFSHYGLGVQFSF